MNSADAEAKRQEAERAAIAQSASAGRASTIVGGMKIAQDDQMARGAMAVGKRAAAKSMGL